MRIVLFCILLCCYFPSLLSQNFHEFLSLIMFPYFCTVWKSKITKGMEFLAMESVKASSVAWWLKSRDIKSVVAHDNTIVKFFRVAYVWCIKRVFVQNGPQTFWTKLKSKIFVRSSHKCLMFYEFCGSSKNRLIRSEIEWHFPFWRMTSRFVSVYNKFSSKEVSQNVAPLTSRKPTLFRFKVRNKKAELVYPYCILLINVCAPKIAKLFH